MLVHKEAIIRGKVQGVFYRGSTREKALELEVAGEVWNNADGSVGLIAEGEEAQVDALLAWCWQGSLRADVQEVIVSTGTIKGFKNFIVKRL